MHYKRKRIATSVIAGVATIALVAGCANGGTEVEPNDDANDASSSVEDQILAAAIEEGEFTLYTAAGETIAQLIIDEFVKDYPEINASFLRLPGGPLLNRYQTEAEAEAVVADVYNPSNLPSFITDNPQWFADITDEEIPNAVGWNEDFREDKLIQNVVESILLVYNSNTVTDVPTSWEDVLDPKYKGKIILTDPAASPGYMSWYAHLQDKFGDEFLEGLAALDPEWVDSGAVGAQKVAAGGADLSFPNYPSLVATLMEENAPIDIVENLDPTQGLTSSVAISADAPNPNAARLFVNWLLSDRGFEVLCSAPVYSAVNNYKDCKPLETNYVPALWDLSEDRNNEILGLLGRN